MSSANPHPQRMLHGPILPTLLRLSAPNVLAMVMTVLVGIAETYYVGRLGTAPLKYGEAMRYEYTGYRRLRVSTYRIIYKVNEDEQLVAIHAIGLRRDIYEH